MDGVRERERERERERKRVRERGENRRWPRWTHAGATMRFFLNLFALLLRSALPRDWYRAICRHWIISVSPWFSTFVSLVQNYIKASNNVSFSSFFYSGQFGAKPELRATRTLEVLSVFVLLGSKSSLVKKKITWRKSWCLHFPPKLCT